MAKLSKRIPARTKTMHFNWVKQHWMTMSPEFRAIRARGRNPMDKCGWCGHSFIDGESMALASVKEASKNTVLCQSCVDESNDSEDSDVST